MKIADGWTFFCADFSIQEVLGPESLGTVLLVRARAEKSKWHSMPRELKNAEDGPPLYIVGAGRTLKEAIESANRLAEEALPIPDTPQDTEEPPSLLMPTVGKHKKGNYHVNTTRQPKQGASDLRHKKQRLC